MDRPQFRANLLHPRFWLLWLGLGLLWLVSQLPYRLLMVVGWVLGNLYYLLIKKERERAVSQMMPALGIEEPEACAAGTRTRLT